MINKVYKKGDEVIETERWGWGVIYKLTQAQIDRAKVNFDNRNIKLQSELEAKEQEMINASKSNGEIQQMFKDYKGAMQIPVEPVADELHQFDADYNFHNFSEIDQSRVAMFVMYQLEDMTKRIDMPITEGMQFFHFYRNIRPHYLNHFVKVYVFGFKKDGVASYTFILPDDRMIVTANDNIDLVKFNIR